MRRLGRGQLFGSRPGLFRAAAGCPTGLTATIGTSLLTRWEREWDRR